MCYELMFRSRFKFSEFCKVINSLGIILFSYIPVNSSVVVAFVNNAAGLIWQVL